MHYHAANSEQTTFCDIHFAHGGKVNAPLYELHGCSQICKKNSHCKQHIHGQWTRIQDTMNFHWIFHSSSKNALLSILIIRNNWTLAAKSPLHLNIFHQKSLINRHRKVDLLIFVWVYKVNLKWNSVHFYLHFFIQWFVRCNHLIFLNCWTSISRVEDSMRILNNFWPFQSPDKTF